MTETRVRVQSRILKYILTYKGRLVLAAVCGFLVAQCNVFTAALATWFASMANDEPVTGNPVAKFITERGWFGVDQSQMALIVMISVLVVLINIPKGIFNYVAAYAVASVTNRVGADIRAQMYAHLQTLPMSFFNRNRTGDLMSRMSNDVNLIQNASNIIIPAIEGPAMIISGLAYMLYISWRLTIVTIVMTPLMALAIDRLSKKIRSLTATTQLRLADVSTAIEESVRGVRIIKSFGMEDEEIRRFQRVNNSSLRAALRIARRSSVVVPSIELMGATVVALILFVGGGMMVNGLISFAELCGFAVLAFYVSGAAKQFGRLNVTYQQTLAGADRVFELLDARSDLAEDPNGVALDGVEGRVEFRDVCFEYNPGEPVLRNLSFKIEPGEIVAIVGPSGAGKSTIADLVLRFYDATGGQVLVEGTDVRHIQTKSLREQIAMVPQETILFSGTIAENISYGKPGADMSEIIEAAKAANAHEFIEPLPKAYETELGEGGVGLSGGQRQRISIARALLKNPRILILDEATSSLDAASEGVVQEALDRLMRGRSTLVIAHRLSTVTGADRIFVIDRGEIAESGSFEALMSGGGLFAQLYRSQHRAQEAD